MIDFDKPVQTREGRKVRILCTDGQYPNYPVVGYIDSNAGTASWNLRGKIHIDSKTDSPFDLVNTPQTKFINVMQRGASGAFIVIHKNRESADQHAGTGRIACLEFKEGDGLEDK